MTVVPSDPNPRPKYIDILGLGVITAIVGLTLVSSQAWDLLAKASSFLLSLEGISSVYALYPNNPVLILKLLDGTIMIGSVQVECSGIVSVAMFGALFAFTVGLIPGRFTSKLIWLSAGISFGIIWNIFRVAFVLMIAHYFGMGPFRLMHFVVGPVIDVLWVATLWSLAMSALTRRE